MKVELCQSDPLHSGEMDSILLESDGGLVALQDLYQRQTILLFMLRFTGCPLCREQLKQAQPLVDELRAKGVEVYAVAQCNGQEAEQLRRDMKLDFTILGDPPRALYRSLQLRRGNLWQLTVAPLMRDPVRGLYRLANTRRPGRDWFQLGGVALIDTQGQLRWRFHQRDAGDMPTGEAIHAAVDEVMLSPTDKPRRRRGLWPWQWLRR